MRFAKHAHVELAIHSHYFALFNLDTVDSGHQAGTPPRITPPKFCEHSPLHLKILDVRTPKELTHANAILENFSYLILARQLVRISRWYSQQVHPPLNLNTARAYWHTIGRQDDPT